MKIFLNPFFCASPPKNLLSLSLYLSPLSWKAQAFTEKDTPFEGGDQGASISNGPFFVKLQPFD